MRIAVGEVKQETNTFSPLSITLEDFTAEHLLEGENVLRGLGGTNTEVWGFTKRARVLDAEIVPLFAASAISGGPLGSDTFSYLQDRLLCQLEAAGPLDGVFLALHGATVAQVPGGEDASGLLLRKVRRVVGSEMPIVVTLDLHANVTDQMCKLATAIIGYRTWPHIDQAERGAEAADLLVATLRGECRPTMALSKLRMLLQGENGQTTSGPMAEIVRLARSWEAEGKCLSASAFLVQRWLDLPEMGCATIVVTDGDGERAQILADRLGQAFWDRRKAFDVRLVPIDEALQRAEEAPGKPVVLADSADSTTSGAPGDSTVLLSRLMAREVACRTLLPMVDAAAVQAAHEAGVGRARCFSLGGKLDNVFSRPIELRAEVEWLGEPSFQFGGPVLTGVEVQMGRVAVLHVRDMHILVSERPLWTVDPGLYRAVGLEPTEAQIVVVKSPNMFRAAYGPIAHEIMVIDAPGLASPKAEILPFERLPRPFYPFDQDWPGAPW
jgi:microcystin degradation protein MlrC